MAKQIKNKLDQLSLLEQERLEEEAEKAKKDKKEKEEKKKREIVKLKKLKKLEKKENKRIKKAINFPYKLLFRISSLLTLLFFILTFFYIQVDIYKAVFYTFWVFFALWGGGGVIMASIYYMISVDKEQELREQKIIDELLIEEEERRIEEEEQREIDQLEKHITQEKYTDLPRAKELTMGEDGEINDIELPRNIQNDIEGIPEKIEIEPQMVLGGEMPSGLPEFEYSDNIDVSELDLLSEEESTSSFELENENLNEVPELNTQEIPLETTENENKIDLGLENNKHNEKGTNKDDSEYIDEIFGN